MTRIREEEEEYSNQSLTIENITATIDAKNKTTVNITSFKNAHLSPRAKMHYGIQQF